MTPKTRTAAKKKLEQAPTTKAIVSFKGFGRWTVSLFAKGGQPFRASYGGGELRQWAFGMDDDLSTAFVSALQQAHAMQNPADYSAWFTEAA
jgi:hypothetical protein